MYHREYPTTPTQQAINGGLDLFVDGCGRNDVPQQLFGLSILRGGTDAQVRAAMPFVQASRHVSRAEIEAMFAR